MHQVKVSTPFNPHHYGATCRFHVITRLNLRELERRITNLPEMFILINFTKNHRLVSRTAQQVLNSEI